MNAECPAKNQVPSLCSDAPLSRWHRAAVPNRESPRHVVYNRTDLRLVFTSSSSVCRNADSGRLVDPSFYTWRPSISGGCRTRLKLSAILAASSPVTYDVQKCGLGDRVPKQSNRSADGVESGRGIPSPLGWGLERGLCPFPRKILACFPSKWCILMHSGERFRPSITATMMFMTSAEV